MTIEQETKFSATDGACCTLRVISGPSSWYVVIDWPAGLDDCPDIWRPKTRAELATRITVARAMIKKLGFAEVRDDDTTPLPSAMPWGPAHFQPSTLPCTGGIRP